MKTWSAEACSNIALVKYMGKSEANVPMNSSLSYGLSHLRSRVEISETSGEDTWESLDAANFNLDRNEIAKFMSHFTRLKKELQVEGSFQVRSSNNFPKGTGLASSASSFAALTMATAEIAQERQGLKIQKEDLAALSRLGSGSSCRSFFLPWALWDSNGVRTQDLPYPELIHQVVILEDQMKEVPSSEAHQRVMTSSLFETRAERAETRLKILVEAFRSSEWETAYRVCWSEFWDMHALFETSARPFGYMSGASVEVLRRVRLLWKEMEDGPLVTMDAGPNVHLLYRPDQAEMAARVVSDMFQDFRVMGSGL